MQLVRYPIITGSCRYGFVVYQDPNVTDIACAGLNGMRMGERTLTVRRATEVRLQLHSCSLNVLSPSYDMCLQDISLKLSYPIG